MIRQAAAILAVLCLSQTPLHAQSVQFVVSAASADIHKGPSVINPVVGHASRGTVLEVTRDVGDWMKVVWPSAPDGVGYVRVSMGTLRRASGSVDSNAAPVAAGRTSPALGSGAASNASAEQLPPVRQSPAVSSYSTPRHMVGLGALIGGPFGQSTLGFGGIGRVWSSTPVGVQVTMSRFGLDSAAGPGRITSTQLAPSVLFSLPDAIGDYVWLRPYVGAGARWTRSAFTSPTPGVPAASENIFGMQTFGGGELTFASAPRFAVSADVGYGWSRESPIGFDTSGLGFSVAGNWYVK